MTCDADGKIVWEFKQKNAFAGIRLPNGNTVICNWGGHGRVGRQPQIIEVSRDKKVVAELFDNKQFKTISGVFLLDAEGDVTKCERLR